MWMARGQFVRYDPRELDHNHVGGEFGHAAVEAVLPRCLGNQESSSADRSIDGVVGWSEIA